MNFSATRIAQHLVAGLGALVATVLIIGTAAAPIA